MNKIIALISTFSISSLSFGQLETNNKLTDSTLVFGYVKNSNVIIGESIDSYCYPSGSKIIEENTMVLISGTTNCNSFSKLHDYFEIIYHNKPYFIKKEDLSPVYDSIYSYSKISEMDFELKEKFKKNAKEVAELLYNQKLKNAIKFLDKCSPKGLSILDWSYYDESEYTDGMSAEVTVYNPTKKKIVYLQTKLDFS